ncbi:hypothetical protein [Nostoc sp.]
MSLLSAIATFNTFNFRPVRLLILNLRSNPAQGKSLIELLPSPETQILHIIIHLPELVWLFGLSGHQQSSIQGYPALHIQNAYSGSLYPDIFRKV